MAETITVETTTTTQAPGTEGNGGAAKTELEKVQDQLKKAEHTIETLKKDTKPAVDLEEIKKQLIGDEAFRQSLVPADATETARKLAETQAALQSETGKNKDGTAASIKITQADEVILSPQEKELVQRVASRRGISFDEAVKLFKK